MNHTGTLFIGFHTPQCFLVCVELLIPVLFGRILVLYLNKFFAKQEELHVEDRLFDRVSKGFLT